MTALEHVTALLRQLNERHAGDSQLQPFYEFLLRIACQGMNIGMSCKVEDNGEKEAAVYIRDTLMASTRTGELTIFDVGAHVGNYVRLLLEVFAGQAVAIHSFEPSGQAFGRLSEELGGFPNVNAYNFGFSDRAGKQTLFSDREGSSLASLYNRKLDYCDIFMDRQEEISLTTIDEFCREQRINRIEFLKLDVEGHELSVLEGAKGMLGTRSVDFIQFEFGGCNIDSRTFFKDLYYLLIGDFDIYRIVKNGLHRISEYREMYEIFIYTNFLAELRK